MGVNCGEKDIPHFAGLIHTEVARLVALVDDIIHLNQLDEGTAPVMESVDLLKIAEDAASFRVDKSRSKTSGDTTISVMFLPTLQNVQLCLTYAGGCLILGMVVFIRAVF